MVSARAFICRFGVGDLSGQHSSVWRVWSARNSPDLYLGTRSTTGKLKVSFHKSGKRNFSLTSNIERELRARGRWHLDTRHLDQWLGGVQVDPGLMLEYRIWFPASDLRHFDMNERETKDVTWLPAPPDGEALEVTFLIGTHKRSENWWPGRNSMGTRLLAEGRVQAGVWVWLVYRPAKPPNLTNRNISFPKVTKTMEVKGVTRGTITPGHRGYLWVTHKDGGKGCAEIDLKTLFDHTHRAKPLSLGESGPVNLGAQ